MKNFQINYKFILAAFVVINCCLFISQTVFGQIEKLGVISYTSPQDWTKDLKQNVVGFSKEKR